MEAEEIRAHGIRDPKDLDAQHQTGTSGYVTGSEVSQLEISSRAGRPDNRNGVQAEVPLCPINIASGGVDPGPNIPLGRIPLYARHVESDDTPTGEHVDGHNSTAVPVLQTTPKEVGRQILPAPSNDALPEDTGPGRVSLDSSSDGASKNIPHQDGQAQSDEYMSPVSQPQSRRATPFKKKKKIIDEYSSFSSQSFESHSEESNSLDASVNENWELRSQQPKSEQHLSVSANRLDDCLDVPGHVLVASDASAQALTSEPSVSANRSDDCLDDPGHVLVASDASTPALTPEPPTSLTLSNELTASDPNFIPTSPISEKNFNNLDGPDGAANTVTLFTLNNLESQSRYSRSMNISQGLLPQEDCLTRSYRQRIETRPADNKNHVIPIPHLKVSKVRPSSNGHGDGFTPQPKISSETVDYGNKFNAMRSPEKIDLTSADSPFPEDILDSLEDEGIVARGGELSTSGSVEDVITVTTAAPSSVRDQSADRSPVTTSDVSRPTSSTINDSNSLIVTPTTSDNKKNTPNTSLQCSSLRTKDVCCEGRHTDPDQANQASPQLQEANGVSCGSEVSYISSSSQSACGTSPAASIEIVPISNLDVEATKKNTVNMSGDANLMDRTNSHKTVTKSSRPPLGTDGGLIDSPNDRALIFPHDQLAPNSYHSEDTQVGEDVLRTGEQPRLDPHWYHAHLTDARDTDLAYETEYMPAAKLPIDNLLGAQGGGDQPVLDSVAYPITDADAQAEMDNPVDTTVHYGPGQDEIRTLVAAGDTLELRRSLRRLGLDGPHLILLQDGSRSNALHIAVQHGYLRCLELLLQTLNPYSTLPSALRARDGQGRTPLQLARALHRAPQIITALMDAMTKCGITEPV